MRIASWFFALLLGVLLFYACAQLPAPGVSSLSLTSHVSNRYTQGETGIPSPIVAVLGDYRGFDLLTAGLLFFTSTLTLFLFFPGSSRLGAWLPAFLGLVGFAAVLGIGFLSFLHGSNFLDYESLAIWVVAPQARFNGALILSCGVLLGLVGFLRLALQWRKAPEGPGDR